MAPQVRGSGWWQNTLFGILALSLSRGAFLPTSAEQPNGPKCGRKEKNCGYFGCFPKGTDCPPDCDRHSTPESCHAARNADGRQACKFNPQYSLGKGLCQKDVVCYDLGNGECSEDCFRCEEFGCLPNETNCPESCHEFDNANDCEWLGGVAGGIACQWDWQFTFCAPVLLQRLNRTLFPPPLLPYPALSIRDGVTLTPPTYPTMTEAAKTTGEATAIVSATAAASATLTTVNAGLSPTSSASAPTETSTDGQSLDWTSIEGRPERLVLFIGAGVGAVALLCVAAFLYYMRAKKARRNKALAAGLPEDSNRRPTLSSPPLGKPPQTQFHRESLILHIRKAVSRFYAEQTAAKSLAVSQLSDNSSRADDSLALSPSASVLALPRKPSHDAPAIDVDAESPLTKLAEKSSVDNESLSTERSSAILSSPFRS